LKCSLSTKNFGYSAMQRAKTNECKRHIMSQACYFEVLKSLDYSFKYKQLKRKCPSLYEKNMIICLPNENLNSILNQLTSNQYLIVNEISMHNSEICNDYCLTYFGAKYSHYQLHSNNCYCIKNLVLDLIKDYFLNESECSKNNLLIRQTGFFGMFILILTLFYNHLVYL
jgi:hypothetical protein